MTTPRSRRSPPDPGDGLHPHQHPRGPARDVPRPQAPAPSNESAALRTAPAVASSASRSSGFVVAVALSGHSSPLITPRTSSGPRDRPPSGSFPLGHGLPRPRRAQPRPVGRAQRAVAVAGGERLSRSRSAWRSVGIAGYSRSSRRSGPDAPGRRRACRSRRCYLHPRRDEASATASPMIIVTIAVILRPGDRAHRLQARRARRRFAATPRPRSRAASAPAQSSCARSCPTSSGQ